MSTFNGIVEEFPNIRVDYFRDNPDRRPLACFLSHIHSDHLAGLETLLSPFVYCSAATKEMLLKLERRLCRINYELGILEERQQKYNSKNLRKILKPIPLETPTTIELSPGDKIQVTLFNANHCPGAVMFLFEGDGKAVLYTGDIRCEPWFVNNIVHKPSMACLGKYTSGEKVLDTIYLDTSITEAIHFQTKAEGIRELLQKVRKYPQDTIFHFQAWTYGYEDVWAALSDELNSKVHVDAYKMRVYSSLLASDSSSKMDHEHYLANEAPRLIGFKCGNEAHSGCLTLDENARIHSCEKGSPCRTLELARKENRVVWIQPCVAHLPNGTYIPEAGVGGGVGDAELEDPSPEDASELINMIFNLNSITQEDKKKLQADILCSLSNGRNIPLDLIIREDGKALLRHAVESIAKYSLLGRGISRVSTTASVVEATKSLPRRITFPYSRHSSYAELRDLVGVFKPKDVWPCTVSPTDWLENDKSIRSLFGDICSGDLFRHDKLMEQYKTGPEPREKSRDTQATSSPDLPTAESIALPGSASRLSSSPPPIQAASAGGSTPQAQETGSQVHISSSRKRPREEFDDGRQSDDESDRSAVLQDSQASALSEHAFEIRAASYLAVLQNARGHPEFQHVGLISTTENHSTLDEDLGER